MGEGAIETVLLLLMFAAGAYLAYSALEQLGAEAARLRDEQIRHGDAPFAELYLSCSASALFAIRLFAAFLAFAVGAAVAGVLGGALAAVAGFLLPVLQLRRLRARRVRRVESQLVEALELLGNSLKSGLTLQQSVELVVKEFPAPIQQEFSLVLAETRLGVDFVEALQHMADRLHSNVIQILAAGVAITKRVGGDLTVIFANLAQTIREQARLEGKLEAVTAQGRFQGVILGALPFALLIVLYFLDRSYVDTLLRFQFGHWAIAAVVVMVILAQVWMRKLLRIDV